MTGAPNDASLAEPAAPGILEDELGVERLESSAPRALGSGGYGLWLLRRLAFGVLTLFVVSLLVFLAINALPGDAAHAILGAQASPHRVEALRAQLGLDRPLLAQYGVWIGHLVTGQLGHSLVENTSVASLIGDRAVNSLVLVALSAAIVIPLSFALGVIAASRQGRLADHTFNIISVIQASLPDFVIGIFLVIIFATTLIKVLPATSLVAPGESPFASPNGLVLPVATLVLAVLPYLSRLVRGSMVDALDSEYVQMARLKGLPERVVVLRHALRNAIVPAIQGSALSLAYLLGGVVAVEFIFSYPGLGTELIYAVQTRDVPAIQATVLLFAAAYVIFNIIADLLTIYATPRLRSR